MTNAPHGNGALEVKTTGQVTSSVAPTTHEAVERSPLRQVMDLAIDQAAAAGDKLSMKDLTVLEKHNDPFRIDRPGAHRDGEWLATTVAELGLANRRIHLRGLHYAIIGRPKPNGTAYTNTEKDWLWLVEHAGKAARFLGYIGFGQIIDQRNAEPVVREYEAPNDPWPYAHAKVHVEIPSAADIEPRVGVLDFTGVQPYRIVLVGEKASLGEVLGPTATSHEADLYLPSGNISDTQAYRIAKSGAEDGRPLVVLYFSDCDPSGWNMPVEVGRKLQAFQALLFPELEFQVHRVALTPNQVREYDLPSTPLKSTEKRADAWQREMGVEQTEIDALASLRPDLLRQLAREFIAPFYDATLDRRVYEARTAWMREAQDVVDNSLDRDQLDQIRAEAETKLAELRDEITAINDAIRVDVSDFDLPPVPPVPEAELNGGGGLPPLIDSTWPWAEQTRALIESKAYRNGGG